MKHRRLLYISNTNAKLYNWCKGVCTLEATYTTQQEDYERFDEVVAASPHVSTYVMVDITEEEYRIANIPHVLGRERKVVMNRQLKNTFPDLNYRYTSLIGREQSGRRDDIVISTAITKPELVEPWLRVLNKNSVALEAIVSLPLFSQYVLDYFDKPAEHILLVMVLGGGLRISFFQNKKLKLSRTIPTLGAGVEQIQHEIEKTHRYLNRARLITLDHSTSVYVIADSDTLLPLITTTSAIANLNYRAVNTESLAEAIGLTGDLTKVDAEYLSACLFFKHPRKNHYAGKEEMQAGHLYRLGRMLKAVALSFSFAAFIAAGVLWEHGVAREEQRGVALTQARVVIKQYQTIEQRLPETPIEPREIKNVVQQIDELLNMRTSPAQAIVPLSRLLAKHPDLKVEYAQWRVISQSNSQSEVQFGTEADPADQGMMDTLEKIVPSSQQQSLTISGHIDAFNGNYDAVLLTLDRFVAILKNSRTFRDVIIIKAPINLSSSASVAGRVTPDTFDPNRAEFSLELRL